MSRRKPYGSEFFPVFDRAIAALGAAGAVEALASRIRVTKDGAPLAQAMAWLPDVLRSSVGRSSGNADGDLLEVYVTYLERYRHLSRTTIESYLSVLRQWILYLKENSLRNALDATQTNVRGFIATSTESGKKGSTINTARSILDGFYKHMMRIGLAKGNPVSVMPLQRVERGLPDALSRTETEEFLNAPGAGFLAARNRFILEMIYSAGLRTRELIGMNLQDIGDDGMITVRRINGSERFAIMGGAARMAHRRYLQERGNELRKHGDGSATMSSSDREALFLNAQGHRISGKAVYNVCRERSQELWPERPQVVGPAGLRNTCIRDLRDGGAPLHAVAALIDLSAANVERYDRIAIMNLADIYAKCHPHGAQVDAEADREEAEIYRAQA